jgi:DNA replication protein DnaC
MARWLETERERLRLHFVDMLARLSEWHAQQGRWREATTASRRALEIEPWREETHRRLMRPLARQEKYTAALQQYERCRRALAANLNIEPMPATQELYERIRRRRSRPQMAIPSPSSQLFGREQALEELQSRLLTPSCRLLTLYGVGGIGKTRLALALAERVREHFLDGVYYAPLTEAAPARRAPAWSPSRA